MRRDAWHAGYDWLPSSATNRTLIRPRLERLARTATEIERMIIDFSATS